MQLWCCQCLSDFVTVSCCMPTRQSSSCSPQVKAAMEDVGLQNSSDTWQGQAAAAISRHSRSRSHKIWMARQQRHTARQGSRCAPDCTRQAIASLDGNAAVTHYKEQLFSGRRSRSSTEGASRKSKASTSTGNGRLFRESTVVSREVRWISGTATLGMSRSKNLLV